MIFGLRKIEVVNEFRGQEQEEEGCVWLRARKMPSKDFILLKVLTLWWCSNLDSFVWEGTRINVHWKSAEFIATALNTLLKKDSRQRLLIGMQPQFFGLRNRLTLSQISNVFSTRR